MHFSRPILSLCCALIISSGASAIRAETSMPVREGDPSCDKRCLNQFVDQYLQALVSHDPHSVPMSKDVKFTENTVRLNVGDGLWSTATGLGDYRLYASDPWAEQAAAITVVLEQDGPKVLALRLRIKNRQITEIESVIARPGSTDPLSPALLTWQVKPIWLEPLKPEERVPRDDMVTAANNYFEAIEHDDGKVVPFDASCTMANREADGPFVPRPNMPDMSKMGCGDMFNHGMMGGLRIPERHFWLVDEERGIVFGAFMFCIDAPVKVAPGQSVALNGEASRQPNTGIIAEMFKIKSGRIYEINNVTGPVLAYGTRSGW